MSIRTKPAVTDVKIVDIRIGDKLLQDITGQEGRSLLYAGTFISHRELLFLRKQLGRPKPKICAERYTINQKTPGGIFAADGSCLVRAGELVTAAKLAPLLDEGFQEVPTSEGGTMFYRKNEWPDDRPWHINDFNPLVRVETTTYVDDNDKVQPDPRGGHVRVGGTAGAAPVKKAVKAPEKANA